MNLEKLISIKIGKLLIWSLATTLLIIESYERLSKKLGLDVYSYYVYY